MENNQDGNGKNKSSTNMYTNKIITEFNESIYAGVKLGCEKIGIPLKSTNKKSKPGWEIRLEMQIRKLRKQAKMIKQRKNAGTCWDKKEKNNTRKITIQLEEINQKELAKEDIQDHFWSGPEKNLKK